MIRATGKKYSSILSVILVVIMLFTGCTQPAVKNSMQIEPAVNITTMAPADTPASGTPAPVSRLSEILDGKKYANQFALWVFNIKQTDSAGKINAGDILLLQSPEGMHMLVDTGHKETISEVLELIKKIGVTQLDYVVATHMHGDHVGGFSAVLNSMPVKNVLSSRHANRSTSTAKAFMNTLGQKDMKLQVIKEGNSFQFGKEVKVDVLSPEDTDFEIPDDAYSNQNIVNEESVVLKVTYGNNTFLLPGDIQMGTEQRLIDKYGESLNVDLVKAPHHGYNTSSSSQFLKVLTPAITLIPQCTMANFDVYQRYKNVNSTVYVTGLDGILLAVSDGKQIKVITEKDRNGTLKP